MQGILKKFQKGGCNIVYTPVDPNMKLGKDVQGGEVDGTFAQEDGVLLYLI